MPRLRSGLHTPARRPQRLITVRTIIPGAGQQVFSLAAIERAEARDVGELTVMRQRAPPGSRPPIAGTFDPGGLPTHHPPSRSGREDRSHVAVRHQATARESVACVDEVDRLACVVRERACARCCHRPGEGHSLEVLDPGDGEARDSLGDRIGLGDHPEDVVPVLSWTTVAVELSVMCSATGASTVSVREAVGSVVRASGSER